MCARIPTRFIEVILLIAVAASLGCGGDGDDGEENPELYEDIGVFGEGDAGTTDEGAHSDDVAVERTDTGRSDTTGRGDDSGTKSVVDRFAGWWSTADGDGELECDGQSLPIDSGPEGRIEIPSDDGLRFYTEGGDCTFEFSRSDRSATLEPGQSCERTADGATETIEPTEWTLTLKPDSQRIEQTYRADATQVQEGQTLSCAGSWEGTLEPGTDPKAFVDEFVGTWTNENAGEEYSVTCSKDPEEMSVENILSQVTPVGRGIQFERGSSSDLSVTTSLDTKLESETEEICTWSLTAERRAASVAPGAECPKFLPGPFRIADVPPRTVETSEYELSEDGESLTHDFRGEISGTADGEPVECTEEWTVTYESSDQN